MLFIGLRIDDLISRGLPRVVLIALLCVPALAAHAELRPSAWDHEAPYRRSLWVTRWDYRSERDVERIFYNASSARFTDVMFQVRGEGTAFYKSPYEPWAWELSGRGSPRGVGVDPGWDPLAVAVREARRRGVRIHAYVNVLPAWAQSASPPEGSGHLYVTHRSWFMTDARGRRMKPGGFYAFLEPGLPEVREYLARLFARLVEDYPVDGLHLDYIRYPHERSSYAYHPTVVAEFKQRYGKSPSQDPANWSAFRRRQITATVREIRQAVNRVRPGLEISAAVLANRELAMSKSGQDALGWLDEGIVDAVVPMNYFEKMSQFRDFGEIYWGSAAAPKTWMGIIAESKNYNLQAEIRVSASEGLPGVAIFSYENLFPHHKSSKRATQVYETFVEAGPSSKPAYRPPAQIARAAPTEIKRHSRPVKVRLR